MGGDVLAVPRDPRLPPASLAPWSPADPRGGAPHRRPRAAADRRSPGRHRRDRRRAGPGEHRPDRGRRAERRPHPVEPDRLAVPACRSRPCGRAGPGGLRVGRLLPSDGRPPAVPADHAGVAVAIATSGSGSRRTTASAVTSWIGCEPRGRCAAVRSPTRARCRGPRRDGRTTATSPRCSSSSSMRGEVAVSRREGKERVWDLAERVYPADVDRAVRRGGCAAARGSAAGYLGVARPKAAKQPVEPIDVGEVGRGGDRRRRRRGLAGRSRRCWTRSARSSRAPRCSRRSTGSCSTAHVRGTSSASSTSWRCTSRRRSAAGATSRCRSCTATRLVGKAGCRSRSQGRSVPRRRHPRGRAVHGRHDRWRPRRGPGTGRLARTGGHRHPRILTPRAAAASRPDAGRLRFVGGECDRLGGARLVPAGFGQDVRQLIGGIAPPRHGDRLETLPARGGTQLVGEPRRRHRPAARAPTTPTAPAGSRPPDRP